MATIRKRGNKYHVQVRRKGFCTQSKSFIKLKDATEWARHIEIQIDRNELPKDTNILKEITLGALVQRYRDEVVPFKKGKDVETIVLNAFLRETINQKTLFDLKTSDFVLYRDKRLREIKAISLKRQIAPLQNMFVIAINEWGLPLKENPLSKLNLKATDNKRERRLSIYEYTLLIEAAKTRRNTQISNIIIFALETGMRRGEILSLTWSQVDLKRRSATIIDTKNGYSRTIPLSIEAFRLLDELEQDRGLVFNTTLYSFKMAWSRILKLTKIKDLHFHDLRHEAISRFFEKGLTVPEVASISGHQQIKMLMRYAHADFQTVHKKIS